MVRLLQKTLDLLVKKKGLPYRYIIRFYTSDVSGFGGLKCCTLELHKRENGKNATVFKSTIKGKSDEIEQLICMEIMNYFIENRNGIE